MALPPAWMPGRKALENIRGITASAVFARIIIRRGTEKNIMTQTSWQETELPLILALDLGSSSTRAILFDRQGRMLVGGLARRSVDLQTKSDGTAVIDADHLAEQTWQCVDEVLEKAGKNAERVAAVGCSTFVSNLVGVDRSGRAVTPLMTYADTRPADDAKELAQHLDEDAIHQRTGCRLHPSYLPARFAWLQRTQPDWTKSSARWISIGEYLILQIFGKTAASYSVASWSGLLNRSEPDWDEELLSALNVSKDQLSGLVDVDHAWSGLSKSFAQRWPALKDAAWYPAIGDGAAANLGSGCIGPQRVAVTIGTSSAIRVVMPGAVDHIPSGLWCYRVDRQNQLLGGALNEGGGVYSWLTRILQVKNGDELQAEMEELPPDGHGLTFLPLLEGERSPGWNAQAHGVLAGLSLATRPEQILRAGLEGIAYRLALVFDLLRPALEDNPQIIASGGALRHSKLWVQIVADAIGLPITRSAVEEASARGVAMKALCALGEAASLQEFPDFTSQTFQPVADAHQRYQQAIQRQRKLYQQLFP
jgi:gluconokinase